MPPKKKTTKTSKKVTQENADNILQEECQTDLNIELLKHLNNLTKKLDNVSKVHTDFVNSLESLKSFTEEDIKDVVNQIKEKEQEFYQKQDKLIKDFDSKKYDLEKQYEHLNYTLEKDFVSKKDDMKREFEQNQYNKAVEVIKDHNQVNVDKQKYNLLEKELNDLKNNMEKTISEHKKDMETSSKKEKEIAVRFKELEFKNQSAEMKATIDQQAKEIASLKSTIDTLKDEISQQRELTKSVAEAGKNPITVTSNSK